MSIGQRKDDHLQLCLQQDVSSNDHNFWDPITLNHRALPELNFNEITFQTQFLNQTFESPFLISSMTGGTAQGENINNTLAQLSAMKQIPMGVGSQRVYLEKNDPTLFQIKKIHPKAILWANLGLVQLNYKVGLSDCQRLVNETQASALIFHLNSLQEAIQLEGDRNFKDLLSKLASVCKSIQVPVIIKETGCGLSPQDAIRCVEAGVAAVDVAGRGGTHWGYVEGLRHPERLELGQMFRNWGHPTPKSLTQIRKVLPNMALIASGGIRHGLDAAKAIALGADMVGMAKPFLVKAAQGFDELVKFYEAQCEALRIAMFCTGSHNLEELRRHGYDQIKSL